MDEWGEDSDKSFFSTMVEPNKENRFPEEKKTVD